MDENSGARRGSSEAKLSDMSNKNDTKVENWFGSFSVIKRNVDE